MFKFLKCLLPKKIRDLRSFCDKTILNRPLDRSLWALRHFFKAPRTYRSGKNKTMPFSVWCSLTFFSSFIISFLLETDIRNYNFLIHISFVLVHQTPDPEIIKKVEKYCRFTMSALNYDDVPEAIKNLELALRLLKTGQWMPTKVKSLFLCDI